MHLNGKLKIRTIAGEPVIIMNGSGASDMTKVISLNSTSEYLWNSLKDKEFTVDDVVRLLTSRYDVDYGRASEDSRAWIEKLSSVGAILE